MSKSYITSLNGKYCEVMLKRKHFSEKNLAARTSCIVAFFCHFMKAGNKKRKFDVCDQCAWNMARWHTYKGTKQNDVSIIRVITRS